MKKCLQCNSLFESNNYICPVCNYAPMMRNGFYSFAPALDNRKNTFDFNFHNQLYSIEAQNFWFKYRNILITYFLNQYFPKAQNFCEIGCGSGYVLSGLYSARPDIQYTGIEIYTTALSLTVSRVPYANCVQADICNLPFEDEFDAIGAFDVLEHIQDDSAAIENIFKALRPNGGFILTVPQHPWLWSFQDVAAYHQRRYSKKSIIEKLSKMNFSILRMTSFMTLLMPITLFSRYILAHFVKTFNPIDELQASTKFTPFFLLICNVEYRFIQHKINLPFGSSLICVARKK